MLSEWGTISFLYNDDIFIMENNIKLITSIKYILIKYGSITNQKNKKLTN